MRLHELEFNGVRVALVAGARTASLFPVRAVALQLGGFHHVAVQVNDVERVAHFYVHVLGLPELKRFLRDDGSLRSIWVGQTDGAFLAIEQLPDSTSRGTLGFSMLAFRIEPAHRTQIVDELKRQNITIEKETGWTIYVRDPEGNLVGLSHHPHDGGARAAG